MPQPGQRGIVCGWSGPGEMTVVGDRLFCVAGEATNGNGVWTSDGTTAGTHLVRDIARPWAARAS